MAQNQDTTARCPHGKPYGGIEQCGECRSAATTAIQSGPPKADTHELEVREQEYRTDAKFLRKKAREWLDDGTAQERNVALKAFDAASKYERLALEIRLARTELLHDQWLVDQKRKLSGGD